jgi:tetratricopeptide (TPR) repeat protein
VRRIVCSFWLAAFVAAVPAVAQETTGIPITTTSAQARERFLAGRALLEALRPSHDARQLFEQAISLDPGFALDEYYLASTAATAKDQATHLAKAVDLASKASPGERLLIRGMQARVHADRALARQLAESLVALYPRDERAHGVLALVYAGQQDYAREIGEYEKAIAINPGYVLAYNQLGYAHRSRGELAAAERDFRQYIALMPGDPNPYDSYAELLMKMGRFDESIAQYRKALAIDPHFGASRIGIAADEMFSGRTGEAVAELRSYYAAGRDDGERRAALLNEAMVHADHGGTDAALEVIDRSLALARAAGDTANMSADDVAAADILLAAGRVDAASGRYRRAHMLVASSVLAKAIKADDELALHYDAARVSLARHDLAAAHVEAAAYSSGATAAQNDVRMRQAQLLNGLLALEEKQPDHALADLAGADQEEPAVLYATSRAYAAKGDRAKAKELSDRAVHLNILPTLSYVLTRASIAGATRSATSGSGRGRRR